MDNFLFRFFDAVWEAIRNAFRKKKAAGDIKMPKRKKKK